MALAGHPPQCPHPIALAVDLKIRMPGGVTLQVPAVALPSPGEQAAKLLGILSASLAPFMPIFDLIDALMTVKVVFKAVVTLNPVAIGDALVDFVLLVDKLKGLLPQISGALLVKDLLIVLRVFVEDLVAQLEALVVQELRISAAEAQAQVAVSAALTAHVTCARATVDVSLAAMRQSTAPVNRILRVVNLVGALAGLPPVPSLTVGVNASASVAPLRSLVAALRALEQAIPG